MARPSKAGPFLCLAPSKKREKDSNAMQQMELGIQPLDGIMMRLGLINSDLVHVSPEQLTHKMVQKGRRGRRLTLKIKMKILQALNLASAEEKFTPKNLFNY